jgi:hypothetical protein
MLKDEYRQLFDLYLRNAHLARDGIFLQPTIDMLLNEHKSGRSDHGNRLWLLLNSEIWYRMFVEKKSVEEFSEGLAHAQQLQAPVCVA